MKNFFRIALILAGSKAFAQDIHFSQMLYSPLNLNPALAGANYDMHAVLNYKTQWKTVATPYTTIGAEFDARLHSKKRKTKGYFAPGINFFNDKAGDAQLSTTFGNLSMAYHLFLGNGSTLGAALMGGFGQRSIDPSALQWGSQYDGLAYDASLASGENFSRQTYSFIDLGGGVLYTYKKSERYMTGNDQRAVNAGLAFYHVNRPNVSFVDNERLNMRTSVFATALIGLGNSHFSAVPGVYLNMQGKQNELLFGSYLKYMLKDQSKYTGLVQASAISAGVFYRNRDAIIVKAMLEKAHYSAGVAYDVNVSSLSEVSNYKGSFEIFIRFVTPSPFAQSKSRI